MKLVVNTNILLKTLVKNSKARALILNPNHRFYLPEYALEEIDEHLSLIMEKAGLSVEEVRLALSVLLTNIEVIPLETILAKWKEAEEIVGSIDKSDVPFVALALSIECDGIWSDDRDLKRQKKVKVWNTAEMIQRG